MEEMGKLWQRGVASRSEKQTGVKDGDETLEAKQGTSRGKFAHEQ